MELADWEQFRGDAHALVDWIIDYRKNLEKYPVVPSVGPNDIYNSLPADPPSGSFLFLFSFSFWF